VADVKNDVLMQNKDDERIVVTVSRDQLLNGDKSDRDLLNSLVNVIFTFNEKMNKIIKNIADIHEAIHGNGKVGLVQDARAAKLQTAWQWWVISGIMAVGGGFIYWATEKLILLSSTIAVIAGKIP